MHESVRAQRGCGGTCGLALGATQRLVDHDARVGQRVPLALRAPPHVHSSMTLLWCHVREACATPQAMLHMLSGPLMRQHVLRLLAKDKTMCPRSCQNLTSMNHLAMLAEPCRVLQVQNYIMPACRDRPLRTLDPL